MHRLVHLATRSWLRANGTFDNRLKSRLIELANKFPTPGPEGIDTCILCAPHAEAIIGDRSTVLIHDEVDVLLAGKLSLYLLLQGRWNDAEVVTRKVLEWLEVLPKEDPRLNCQHITILRNFAQLMFGKGSYKECDIVIRKLLEVARLNGEDKTPDVIIYIRYLHACSNRRQGRLDIAIEMFADNIRQLDACTVDPSNVFLKLFTLNILGLNYEELGLYKEAEESCQQAL